MSGEMLDLEAIEARANAATSGPWDRVPQSRGGKLVARRYETGNQMNPTGLRLVAFMVSRGDSLAEDEANADFVSHARTDIPALVAEVRRLKEAVQDADDARHDALLIAETWEVDAGRYRFLRDNPLGFRAVDGAASVPPHPDVMDRWVDAALAEAAHD